MQNDMELHENVLSHRGLKRENRKLNKNINPQSNFVHY